MDSQISDSMEADKATIRSLYEEMIDGWNKGSGQAFAAPYTDNSDFIGFDGTYMNGRQEIASFHQILFDKFLKGEPSYWKDQKYPFSYFGCCSYHCSWWNSDGRSIKY